MQKWSKISLKHSLFLSVAFFPSLKQNFIVYRSSKVSSRPDCIFKIYQLWQSGFSRVYSNSSCSCSFEPEIIKIVLPSDKMYCNNISEFSRVYANSKCSYEKKSGNLSYAPRAEKTTLFTLNMVTGLKKKTKKKQMWIPDCKTPLKKWLCILPLTLPNWGLWNNGTK